MARPDTRQASGSRGGRLYRTEEDPNNLVILLEWDDLQRAREFAQSDDLRETMQRAGVADQPDVYFLQDVERVSGWAPESWAAGTEERQRLFLYLESLHGDQELMPPFTIHVVLVNRNERIA
jgi:heme-degrading monooxygenase HmoA